MIAQLDGNRMQRDYDRLLREPVPERLRELIRRLEEATPLPEANSPGEANARETLSERPNTQQQPEPK